MGVHDGFRSTLASRYVRHLGGWMRGLGHTVYATPRGAVERRG